MCESIAAFPFHFCSGAAIMRRRIFPGVQTVHIQLNRIISISLHGRIVDAAAVSSAARTFNATNLEMTHSTNPNEIKIACHNLWKFYFSIVRWSFVWWCVLNVMQKSKYWSRHSKFILPNKMIREKLSNCPQTFRHTQLHSN